MQAKLSLVRIAAAFLILLSGTCIAENANAQQVSPGEIELDIIALPALAETQTLSIQRLITGSVADDSRLFTLTLENLRSLQVGDLYLTAIVSASGRGRIVEVDQREPFSMQSNQVVVGNNTHFRDGLPGVPERTSFSRELTSAGEAFLNELRGSTRLPDLIYTFTIQLYQDGPRGQGRLIAETSASVPVEGMSDDLDIYLLQPGEPLGAEAGRVQTPYPVFRWEGSPRNLYRIIVVEATEGQTPETLIQSAISTNPVISQNVSPSTQLPLDIDGSLLEYEMVDALVSGTYFNYPSSGGARQLTAGNTYYWQVFHLIRTTSGTESRSSEIFQFRMGGDIMADSMDEEQLMRLVERFIDSETLERLQNAGFDLASLNVDGEPASGPVMIQILEDLLRQLDEGEIERVED